MLNEATKANLRRKEDMIETVQMYGGDPLPSWIDLNVTELCNRKCVFCPRVDPALYPNQNLHMSLDLARRLARQLEDVNFSGTITLSGFGEPMLHPEFAELVRIIDGLDKGWRVELVTNGDKLSARLASQLVRECGIDCIVVSMYDGPHQVDFFHEMFRDLPEETWFLRDRWHPEEEAFGLLLTNRAGTVKSGPQIEINASRPCHYLAYQMTIDWNGDVLLCTQDWHKRVKFGNLANQSLVEVWTSPAMRKRRMQLISGRRCEAPCKGCNTDGMLYGANHVQGWLGEMARECA